MEKFVHTTLLLMRDDVIARLPGRVVALEPLLAAVARGERGAVKSLHREAHNLVSVAGTHHLMKVFEAAHKLEQIVAAVPADRDATNTELLNMREALENLAIQVEQPSYGFVPFSAQRHASQRIVVVDDDVDQVDWLRSVLEQAGYQVEVYNTLSAFRDACQKWALPAAVIMDVIFPEGEEAGVNIVNEMRSTLLSGLPVIFLSERNDIAAKLAAYRAGSTRYLTKPVDRKTLLQAVNESAALRPTEPYRILLVDDDPVMLSVHASLLQHAGMEVRETCNPLLVPQILDDFAAEVLVLDMYMPQCSGPELAAILRDDARHAELPIIYLSGETDISRQLLALDLAGDHFLTKPVEPSHLVSVVNMQARRFRQGIEQREILRSTLYENERHQQALDAHAIVSATDTTGNIIYANDNFCEVSGYSRDELLGNNHRIVKSGIHPPEIYADMWRTIKRGQIWHGELCNKRKDGSLYWVKTSIVPFLDIDGRPYQYISIRTDITRLKQHDEALRKSESQLRMVLDHAADAMFVAGKDERWVYVNDNVVSMLGYSREELLGMSIYDLVPVDWRETYRKIFHEMQLANGVMRQEIRLVKKDGSKIPIEMNAAVLPDGTVYGSCRDISARKKAEEALKAAAAKLRDSQQRLNQAQQVAHLGSFEWDTVSGDLQWSDEHYRLWGLQPGSVMPSFALFRQGINTDDLAELDEAFQQAMNNRENIDCAFLFKMPNGNERVMNIRAEFTFDDAGRAVKLVGTVQDITQRKKIEAELRAAKDTAESASRAKSEFLASMSHELRTPLNAILGFSQLFVMDNQLPLEVRNNASEIEHAGQHLLSLVNDMIDLARIEAGRLELSLEPVSERAMVKDSLAMVASLARNYNVNVIDGGCSDEKVMVWADYVRLRQVVINLLSNAIKYNRPQGTVHISCLSNDCSVRISVADTGPGIPGDKQARIFNSFDRLGEERGKVEGTGIGLVITKRIVEAMNGKIGFESVEGQGSTFWVEFPIIVSINTPALEQISASSELDRPFSAADRAPSMEGLQTGRSVVLYIEDNPMNMRLMQQILASRKNLELRQAESAESGIEMALANPPALILMDINLAGMNGYQALAILKADARTAHIPAIAVSANAMMGDRERGMQAGFFGYVTKPIDIPALLGVLDKALSQNSSASGADA